MFKILIWFSLLLSVSHIWARVEARWLTVAGLVLEDGKTRIIFDPTFSRAGLKHWFNLAKFRSDEELVKKTLKDLNIDRSDAVFITHSHFDHSVDATMVAKYTQAPMYLDNSSERIAKAYKDPSIKLIKVHDLQPIQIGDFSIIPLLRTHSKIKLFDYEFLPGPVPENFDFDFYDYKVGETWYYVIKHPSGTILIDQGGDPWVHRLKGITDKADVLIQGISNRESDESFMNGYLKQLGPKLFMANHFDNFFFAFDPAKPVPLLPMKLEELIGKINKQFPDVKTVIPKFAERIELLK